MEGGAGDAINLVPKQARLDKATASFHFRIDNDDHKQGTIGATFNAEPRMYGGSATVGF